MKNKKYLILFFLCITVAIILWVFQFSPKKTEENKEVASTTIWKEVNINFDVLNSPLLEQLTPFTKISPFDGQIGKENPFLP
mgnify:FL=1|jgi:hypothetical protein